ncbi:MAG: pectate lyase [Acidobacteria bacterium]|nr:pectate lyase [Acidobacteriota bacterium]MCI0621392.1 pectate lyase [Acidobacteriota bacterium]MCI0722720.1 pectate lyase [Acidobacteriota bacterium]
MKKRAIPLALISLLIALLPTRALFPAKIFDKTAKKQLRVYLDDICQWILAREQASRDGKIQSVANNPRSLQGNLARVLLAGSELTKNNTKCMEEALRWCDAFAARQQRVSTSLGSEGGCWSTGEGPDVDLSENSMAAVALARGHAYADGSRRKSYRQALERYGRFLLEGVRAETGQRPSVAGWLLQGGSDGAIGGGFKKDVASLKPSTASTAAGAAFLAQLYALSRERQHRDAAVQAVEWILKSRRPTGEMPNFIDGAESEADPFTTLALCGEAIQSVYYLLDDASFNQRLGRELDNTVRRVMRIQEESGLWGEGADRRGSSGVATLLAWHYLSFKGDETIPQSLDKFWQNLSNPVHAQSFGVLLHPISTAWMGLTTAEMIRPGITFKKM